VNHQLIDILLLTLMAGLAMPAGAALAFAEHIRPQWLETEVRHTVVAFGGGALLSAVALVLVPDGIRQMSPMIAMAWLVAGGMAFMALDIVLYRVNTPASQLASMLSDFVPEALALGAAFSISGSGAVMLAVLMTLQNLPEGFNAFRELKDLGRFSAQRILTLFTLMALIGPLAAIFGYIWLADATSIVEAIMVFAAGGILYSVFQDIAPQVKLDKHWAPPMGAVLGFAAGVSGHIMVMAAH